MNTQKMASNNSNRITYVDSAKGLGIIFVVLAHLLGVLVYNDPKPFIRPIWLYLCSVTIAFFFLTSGFTMAIINDHSKDFRILIKKKASSIMYPYVVFSVIYLVYKLVSYFVFNNNKYSLMDIEQCIVDILTLRGSSVLWFLSSLFLGTILYSFLFRKCGRSVTLIINIIITIIIMIFSPRLEILHNEALADIKIYVIYDLATTVLRTFTTSFCLNIGFEFFNIFNKLKINKIKLVFTGLIFTAISFVLSQYVMVDFANNYYDNALFAFICICVGSTGLMLLVKNILDFRFLRFLGDKSLIIMLTHIDFQVLPYALTISYSINRYINHGKEYALYLSILLLTVIFEAFWIFVFDKFLKFLLKKPS